MSIQRPALEPAHGRNSGSGGRSSSVGIGALPALLPGAPQLQVSPALGGPVRFPENTTQFLPPGGLGTSSKTEFHANL